ncbi:glucosyltransferase domain-containing protein [Bordetella sp. LUAb4]|uniref:glucosyltransferase domain-containing protein n=1 Tax=Bordetella sp. LUAb4 TaxID=2843195 RepID=UPI001E615381|nr:glucosyltransferase domain-containing protein [Bordetella sp. LUAb4]
MKLPLLTYPSVDDMSYIQSSLIDNTMRSAFGADLGWGRITSAALLWIIKELNISDYVVGQLLFFPVELLFASIIATLVLRLKPSCAPFELCLIVIIASFHPGIIELNSFTVTRPGIATSFLAMFLFSRYSDPGRPFLLAIWTACATFVVMTSYQGATNLMLLCMVTVLLSTWLQKPDSPAVLARQVLALGIGFLIAAIINTIVLKTLSQLIGIRQFYALISPHAMLSKLGQMAARFPDQWNGSGFTPQVTATRRVVMIAILISALIASIKAKVLGRREAWVGLGLVVSLFVVAMQPLSLPFDYMWFPPRTAFWFFGALLIACAAFVSRLPASGTASRIWLTTLSIGAAIVVVHGSLALSAYSALRQNDQAIAREIVARMQEHGFNWKEDSVYVELRDWNSLPAFLTTPQTIGDMVSVFLPPWSRVRALEVAARTVIRSPADGADSAKKVCAGIPPNRVRYDIVFLPGRAIICF